MNTGIPTHGGARAGAGRPRADEGAEDGGSTATYNAARAREMQAKADLKEMEVEVRRGQLVERVAVRQAVATACQLFAQTSRSVADNLERNGVPPEVCAKVDEAINDALAKLAADLEAMCKMGQEA